MFSFILFLIKMQTPRNSFVYYHKSTKLTQLPKSRQRFLYEFLLEMTGHVALFIKFNIKLICLKIKDFPLRINTCHIFN